METCPKCKLFLARCDCSLRSRPGADTEQAFWDACVAGFIVPFAGHGAMIHAIVGDACEVADQLVIERRKRLAARAKEG